MSLEISHGVVRRGRRTVLEAGHIATAAAGIAMVGINGSGKSSLFMHLADALLTSRHGSTIMLHGRAASLAYVPQIPALPDWLRVEAVAQLYGLDPGALIDAMPELHLHEVSRTRAGALSLGQKQALCIALALGRNADVTMLDEPFSALDFRRRIGAVTLLRRRLESGGCILLSSQSVSDLTGLCAHYVVIRDGRYVFNGSREDLDGSGDEGRFERALLDLLV